MTVSNRERVGRVLDLLRDGLYPFVEREMRSIYGDKWVVAATPFVPEDHSLRRNVQQILKQDESALL
ncbi:MAG: Swt1 family HEPN domain-containing protein, partial [Nostoc sp.]